MGSAHSDPNYWFDKDDERLKVLRENNPSAEPEREPTNPPHWVQAPVSQLIGRCVMKCDDARFTDAVWLKYVSPRRHMIVWQERAINPRTLGPEESDGQWMSVPGQLCGGLQEMKQFFEEEKRKAKERRSSERDVYDPHVFFNPLPVYPPPRNGEPQAHSTSEME